MLVASYDSLPDGLTFGVQAFGVKGRFGSLCCKPAFHACEHETVDRLCACLRISATPMCGLNR